MWDVELAEEPPEMVRVSATEGDNGNERLVDVQLSRFRSLRPGEREVPDHPLVNQAITD